jgi:hypothetical protein
MISDKTFDDWALNIEGIWRSQGIGLQPGVPGPYIQQTAKDLGIVVPPAFVALYERVNGFKGNDWTSGTFVIWPLERMLDEYRAGDDSNFVGFSDFLIYSHMIGFRKDKPGIFNSLAPEKVICATFEEAIELINGDSILVH